MIQEPRRKVLVTGASGALGGAIFNSFDQHLAWVFGQHWQNPGPPEGLSTRCDLRDVDQVERLVKANEPNNIIHAAGVNHDGMSWKLPLGDWCDTLAVNLNAAWHLARFALPKMREQHYGRIIFISSVVGSVGIPGTSAYAASKAGLIGMTKSVARELARKNVTANCIAPGFIVTEMTDKLPEAVKDAAKQMIPLRRFGSVDDVAKAAAFLASDESGYITGQVLFVDGGMAM